MKRITKIRIPATDSCDYFDHLHCPFQFVRGHCGLFKTTLILHDTPIKHYHEKAKQCLKMFPNGAVFELEEKK